MCQIIRFWIGASFYVNVPRFESWFFNLSYTSTIPDFKSFMIFYKPFLVFFLKKHSWAAAARLAICFIPGYEVVKLTLLVFQPEITSARTNWWFVSRNVSRQLTMLMFFWKSLTTLILLPVYVWVSGLVS